MGIGCGGVYGWVGLEGGVGVGVVECGHDCDERAGERAGGFGM